MAAGSVACCCGSLGGDFFSFFKDNSSTMWFVTRVDWIRHVSLFSFFEGI